MEAANSDSHVQQRRKNRHGHSQFPKRGVRHSFAAAPKVSHVPLSLPFKYTEHSTTTFVGCPWQKKSGGGGKSPPPRTTKQRHAFGPGCESRRRKRLRGACDNEIGRQTVKKTKKTEAPGDDDSHTYAHTCAQHSSSVKEGESFHVPDFAFAVFSPSQSSGRRVCAHNTTVSPT